MLAIAFWRIVYQIDKFFIIFRIKWPVSNYTMYADKREFEIIMPVVSREMVQSI